MVVFPWYISKVYNLLTYRFPQSEILSSPLIGGSSAAATKAAFVSVAHKVQRRWRRMGRSIENPTRAPSSDTHHQLSTLQNGLMRRTSSAVNFIRRRLTQPVRSAELAVAHGLHRQQLTTSNSTIDLGAAVVDSEWYGDGRIGGECLSASTTPNQMHSPRRQGTSLTNSAITASTSANRRHVINEVEMKANIFDYLVFLTIVCCFWVLA